jgi:hypothetical protein
MEQVILVPRFYVERQDLALEIAARALVQLKVSRFRVASARLFPENIGKANRCSPRLARESTNPLSLEDLGCRLQNPGIGFDRARLHGFLEGAQR